MLNFACVGAAPVRVGYRLDASFQVSSNAASARIHLIFPNTQCCRNVQTRKSYALEFLTVLLWLLGRAECLTSGRHNPHFRRLSLELRKASSGYSLPSSDDGFSTKCAAGLRPEQTVVEASFETHQCIGGCHHRFFTCREVWNK